MSETGVKARRTHMVSAGSRLRIGRKGPRTHARAHTLQPCLSLCLRGPFCLRRLQPLNRPGKRNPHSLPNQATTPPSAEQRPGALPTHTCLSAGLTAWEGASSTSPCPSARLTGASRQEMPPPPNSWPSAHLTDAGGQGRPQGLSADGADTSPPWVGPALRLSLRLG